MFIKPLGWGVSTSDRGNSPFWERFMILTEITTAPEKAASFVKKKMQIDQVHVYNVLLMKRENSMALCGYSSRYHKQIISLFTFVCGIHFTWTAYEINVSGLAYSINTIAATTCSCRFKSVNSSSTTSALLAGYSMTDISKQNRKTYLFVSSEVCWPGFAQPSWSYIKFKV